MSMSDLTREGRLSLAAGMAGLGACSLIWGDLNPGLQPPLELLGQGPALAYATGAFLFLAGICLCAASLTRAAGRALGVFWLAWLVLGNSMAVFAAPADVTAWVALVEVSAIAVAAMLVADSHYGDPTPRLSLTARGVTGLMLVWFGVVHIIYRQAISEMIPGWIPLQDLWPWVTGAANIAAGLAILTGVLGRWAAALTGLMFASWIALVHIPRLMASPTDRAEWTALSLNLALIGVVWIVQGDAWRRSALNP